MQNISRPTAQDVISNAGTGKLKGIDLAGLNLKNADLNGALLQHANLSGVDLTGATLRKANLTGACFRNAKLQGADLSEAVFNDAILEKAILTNAIMENTFAVNADFSESDLKGVKIINADLTKANLTRAIGFFCRIQSSNLAGVRLKDAEFDDSFIQDTSFLGSDLSGASFINSTMIDVDAQGSSANKVNVSLAKLIRVKFSKANLDEADFYRTRFENVDLTQANIHNAYFTKTKGLSGDSITEFRARGAHVLHNWFIRMGLRTIHARGKLVKLAVFLVFFALLFIRNTSPGQISELPEPFLNNSVTDNPKVGIICAGDRHTYSDELPKGLDYPSQLEALLNTRASQIGFEVFNEGHSGLNSSQAVAKVIEKIQTMEDGSIDMVIFSCGKNNKHKLIGADYLPEDIRNTPAKIFPYLLENKENYRFSPKTVSNLERLVNNNISPEDVGWGEVISDGDAREDELIKKGIIADLGRLQETLEPRHIALMLLTYYQYIPWYDNALVEFAQNHNVLFVPITSFGVSNAAMDQYVSNYSPNEYGNAKVAEIIYRSLCAAKKFDLCSESLENDTFKTATEETDMCPEGGS